MTAGFVQAIWKCVSISHTYVGYYCYRCRHCCCLPYSSVRDFNLTIIVGGRILRSFSSMLLYFSSSSLASSFFFFWKRGFIPIKPLKKDIECVSFQFFLWKHSFEQFPNKQVNNITCRLFSIPLTKCQALSEDRKSQNPPMSAGLSWYTCVIATITNTITITIFIVIPPAKKIKLNIQLVQVCRRIEQVGWKDGQLVTTQVSAKKKT